MNKLIFLTFLLGSIFQLSAQNTERKEEKDPYAGHNHAKTTEPKKISDDVLVMNEVEFDFGKIPQGKPVYHSFEILNNGKETLKLENIQTTCGCTTPEWSKEPIAAGKTTIIKVGFNAASEGAFEKFITIQYNGNASKQIKIKGIVWKAPADAAPANPSIQFLKQQIQIK